jgi:hypothetical protein
MKALNYKEKSDSIIKFILLFALTSLIVGLCIYINFTFQNELTEKQRLQLSSYRNYKQNEKKIIHLIDTLDSQISNELGKNAIDVLSQQKIIQDQIEFKKLSNEDTTYIKLTKVLDNLMLNYLKAKALNVNQIEGKDETIGKLKDEKERLQEKIDNLNEKYKDCDCS